MKKIFKEYGSVIVVSVAVCALISLVIALMQPSGALGKAFEGITQMFADKTSSIIQNSCDLNVNDGYDEDGTLEAGLYQTGSNYTVQLKTWQELLDSGVVHVENGVVYTVDSEIFYDSVFPFVNACSAELAGDLKLPDDGSVIALGNLNFNTGEGNIAFGGCVELTGIYIPDSVTQVNALAFVDCLKLSEIIFPNSSFSIGYGAFMGCTGLTDVKIPNTLTAIDDKVFAQCTSLRNVVLPDNLSAISKEMFVQCTSLNNIVIPGSVTKLYGACFGECVSLSNITFQGSVEQWKAIEKGLDPVRWNYNCPVISITCTGDENGEGAGTDIDPRPL